VSGHRAERREPATRTNSAGPPTTVGHAPVPVDDHREAPFGARPSIRTATVSDSMQLKLAIGREKIRSAIEGDQGTTVNGAHLLPHVAPWLPGVLDAGIKILEFTHSSLYLSQNPPRLRVDSGGRFEAFKASYGVPVEQLAERLKELRPALLDTFITVSAPGTFNQLGPATFDDRSAFLISQAGGDGIHCHQSSLNELAILADIAHRHGLLVEAYIHRFLGEAQPFSYMGIRAETPAEVRQAVRDMESVGVDIVGVMFSADPTYYSQEGATEHLSDDMRERIRALTQTATRPTSVEGQITAGNAREMRELGVNILVLGTLFDLAIEAAIKRVVDDFSGRDARPPSLAEASRQARAGRPVRSRPVGAGR
jgi:cyclase